MGKKIVLSVIIHQTPAALRYGSDGYLITFAGTEEDKDSAKELIGMNNRRLKITIEEE